MADCPNTRVVDGVAVVAIPDMLRGEGFAHLEGWEGVNFDRCPLAFVAPGPECPMPQSMPWLTQAHDAAAIVAAGMSVRDYDPDPSPVLIDAVAAIRREADAAAAWQTRMAAP